MDVVQILYAATRLKGPPGKWIEPRVRDYLDNKPENRDTETDNLFRSYAAFITKLRATFGDVDKE